MEVAESLHSADIGVLLAKTLCLLVDLNALESLSSTSPDTTLKVSRTVALEIIRSIKTFRHCTLGSKLNLLADLVVTVAEAIWGAIWEANVKDTPLSPLTFKHLEDLNTLLLEIQTFMYQLAHSSRFRRWIQHWQNAALISEYQAKLATRLGLLRDSRSIERPIRRDTISSISVSSYGYGSRVSSPAVNRWPRTMGATTTVPLMNHIDSVTSVAVSPCDGRHMVSGSRDGTVRLWDSKTGVTTGDPLVGHTGDVTSVAFSPDGRLVASGSNDMTVRLWDSHKGTAYRTLAAHEDVITSVAFSPDGRLLVSGSSDQTLRLWDAATGVQIGEPLEGHNDAVTSVDFSPDGSKIISVSADKSMRIWDVTTGAPILGPWEKHTCVVTSAAVSPDMAKLVSCSEDATLRIWYVSSPVNAGEQIYQDRSDTPRSTTEARIRRRPLQTFSRFIPDPSSQFSSNDLEMISITTPEHREPTDTPQAGILAADYEYAEGSSEHSDDPRHPEQLDIQTDFSPGLQHEALDLSEKVVIKEGPVRAGGHCDIYLGELSNGKELEPIAMKQLRTFLSWNDSQRAYALSLFCREVELWSIFHHRFILSFYGFAVCNERQLFMISPWISNGHCVEYLLRHPATNRRRLLWQVADALRYLHSGGAGVSYVHGDIKGDNVLISNEGDALLADFGLMRHVEAVSTAMATPSGIPLAGHIRFTAPELLIGEGRPSPASDVFAFAGLILQIFTGQPPFPELKEHHMMFLVLEGVKPSRPDSPETLGFGLDDAMWDLANDCWEREPSRRPTMQEIAMRLEPDT